MISAKIVCDSLSPENVRLTTLSLIYPRFIHSEFMTHRVFSRNASSSRAIPIEKLINRVQQDTAWPIHLGLNQPGMQARQELPDDKKDEIMKVLTELRDVTIEKVKVLSSLGLHKQVANRYLEPFAHIHVVVTATSWANFFNLRRHLDAQPEIKDVSDRIYNCLYVSKPTPLEYNQWHLPFISEEEKQTQSLHDLLAYSTARCARVSYMNHEGKIDHEKDRELHNSLISGGHMSPLEHQAMPLAKTDIRYNQTGNFMGWLQYRKQIPNEDVFPGQAQDYSGG